jgi:hypothetical protein
VNPSIVANIACGLLIMVYAWGRFNTPSSNRQSTRRGLYRWSCAGYIGSAVVLFALLSFLLADDQLGLREFLSIPKDKNLSAPLLATLAMTTLLPSVPILKSLDSWLLSRFQEWGAIPAEAKRRAAAMTPHGYIVTPADVAALRDAYDGAYGDTLTKHLRHQGLAGVEQAELRFTRVVKLYDQIQRLEAMSNYARFFAETAEEWAGIERQVDKFLQHGVEWLDRAVRLHKVDAAAYVELMEDRNEVFARDCREVFIVLVGFLARAVLRSEGSERGIVVRLLGIGFPTTEPMNLPEFPISSMTVLGAGIFLYLLAVTIVFSYAAGAPDEAPIALAIPSKIALARIAAVGLTVWLMQRYAFFRRSAGEPLRYHAYLLNGLIAGTLAAVVCVAFHFGSAVLSRDDIPVITLSVLLCTAVALCCDDSPEEPARPHRLRVLEALGCGAVMACGTALLYFLKLLPVAGTMSGGALAAWIALPTAMAMMIGGFVPHIYRRARVAAAARREAAAPALAAPALAAWESPPRICRPATTAPAAKTADGMPGWTPLRRRARGESKAPATAA